MDLRAAAVAATVEGEATVATEVEDGVETEEDGAVAEGSEMATRVACSEVARAVTVSMAALRQGGTRHHRRRLLTRSSPHLHRH